MVICGINIADKSEESTVYSSTSITFPIIYSIFYANFMRFLRFVTVILDYTIIV